MTASLRPGADSHHEDSNTSNNPSISSLIDTRLSRRGVLRMGVGTAGAAVMGSFALTACGGGGGDAAVAVDYKLGFTAVEKSLLDVVAVPSGYTANVVYALGDPLTSGTAAYKNDGTDTDFDNRSGRSTPCRHGGRRRGCRSRYRCRRSCRPRCPRSADRRARRPRWRYSRKARPPRRAGSSRPL